MTKKLFLFFFLIPLFTVAQRNISGSFTPAENYKWGILYRVTTEGNKYITDTKIDEAGVFNMSLDSTVTGGVFRIVYGVPPEEHNFELIYSGAEDINLVFSEEEGVRFIASEENITWDLYLEKMSAAITTTQKLYEKPSVDPYAAELLFKLQRKTQESFEERAKDLLVGHMIRASRPYIPTKFESWDEYLKQTREHYFTYTDVTSEVLQNSVFLLKRTFDFIEEKEDTDTVAEFLKPASTEYQKSLLLELWQELVLENRIEIANYLSRNHIIPLAKKLEDTTLVDQLLKFESLSVGARAPNFSWKDEESNLQWFHELKEAENFILVFWSSSCSHCLSELPRLQKAIREFPKGKYQVVAFGLEDDIYSWRNEILRLPEFYHIPGMGKWENPTGKAYDVGKTPTYFLLDKDKTILAKPKELKDLMTLITSE